MTNKNIVRDNIVCKKTFIYLLPFFFHVYKLRINMKRENDDKIKNSTTQLYKEVLIQIKLVKTY